MTPARTISLARLNELQSGALQLSLFRLDCLRYLCLLRGTSVSNRSPRWRSHGCRTTWGSVRISSSMAEVLGSDGEWRLVNLLLISIWTAAPMSPEEKSSFVRAPRGMTE